MEERSVKAADSDVEELEPVEDLEEAIDDSGGIESSDLLSSFLRDMARSYNRSVVPVAILDANLAFIHQNPLFKALIREYHYSPQAPFPSLFAENMTDSSRDDASAALADPSRGYSWKGTVEHRSKNRPARVTKILVQPYWPLDDKAKRESAMDRPTTWTITLDDITLESKRYRRDSLESLLKASLKKDRDTGNHVKRVNLYSRRIAEELFRDPRWPEIDVDYIEEIGFLAAMHDIGKIGTPDDILNKKGPLNEGEWKIMREHTINGAFILSDYPNEMAKEIALSHHEWWNGSGYPFSLMGSMIPLSARIVSLADVYDALRMERSYKQGYSHEVTVAKMIEEEGKHFDPDLIEVFASIGNSLARIYEEHKDEGVRPVE